MTITLPVPPKLPGHIWRALQREDAHALHRLELYCASTDGSTNLSTVADYQKKLDEAAENPLTDTLCAVDANGQLAMTAWVTCDNCVKHEYRAFLEGNVHPDHRGRALGSFVLQWMEARARQILATLSDDRPCVLRIDFYDRSDDAIALFEKDGFRFALAEDEMRRDLSQPIPAVPLPEGMTFVTWSPRRAALFFTVYDHAFRDRPGFPGWSQDVWRYNLTGDPDFRRDLSLLILDGTEAVGFTICHIEVEADGGPSGEGWITQMGVRPPWRNRGLGSALLSEVMQRLEATGLRYAMLEVNTNNSKARSLYRRLGFEDCRRRSSFQKRVTTSGPQ